MGSAKSIRDALSRFAAKYGPAATMLAVVKDVDSVEQKCTLVDDDIEYGDVRLRPVLDGKQSLTMYPKIGAWALALRIEDTEDWMLIAAGEFEGFKIKIGDTEYIQENNGFSLNRGEDSLKDALILMIEAVQQIAVLYGNNPDYIKLNQAIQKINQIFL